MEIQRNQIGQELMTHDTYNQVYRYKIIPDMIDKKQTNGMTA